MQWQFMFLSLKNLFFSAVIIMNTFHFASPSSLPEKSVQWDHIQFRDEAIFNGNCWNIHTNTDTYTNAIKHSLGIIEWHSSRFTFNYSKIICYYFFSLARRLICKIKALHHGDIISRLIYPEINFYTCLSHYKTGSH